MAYDLVYNSDAAGYYSHLGTIQRMIDSFEVDSPFVFEIPSGLNGFSVYENRELGIKFEYPDDWTPPFELGGLMFLYAPGVGGENVNISVDDSLDVSLSSDDLEAAARLTVVTLNGTRLESGWTSLGGYPAYEIAYTVELDGETFYSRQVFMARGRTQYVLTYTAFPSTYMDYLDEFQDMIDSFELLY